MKKVIPMGKRSLLCAACIVAAVFCCLKPLEGQPSLVTDEQPTLVRSTTSLVVVDVVVVDAQQRPVHGLSESVFTVLEDGKPQTISSFEEHSAGEATKFPPAPQLPAGVFSDYSPAPENGALTVILLDRLNTPVKFQPVIRNQLLAFIKEESAETPVAIFGLDMELHLLQGFTTDPALLRAAIEQSHSAAPRLLGNSGASDAAMNETSALADGADMVSGLQDFLDEQQTIQQQMRAQYTGDGFNQLSRFLSGFPGRKNLIWFSGSFPTTVFPDATLPDSSATATWVNNELRQTMETMERSQIAVYPIDARGLVATPLTNASNSGEKYTQNPAVLVQDQMKVFQQDTLQHTTMMQIAQATGGHAFFDTNGLKQAVQIAVEDGSNYYTLSYNPANRNWNGAYRRIAIQVNGGGYKLAYRRGYVAAPPDESAGTGTSAATTAYSAMKLSMRHGAPAPSQIIFDAGIRPDSAQTEASLAPGNQGAAGLKGPFRRYDINLAASARNLLCPPTEKGGHRCNLEFVTFVYDAEGALVNMFNRGVDADLSAAQFETVQRQGLRYREQVSVPVNGAFFLRIGIHDLNSDHVGALEVPVSAVNRLEPAAKAPPR